jgi:MFS family permease
MSVSAPNTAEHVLRENASNAIFEELRDHHLQKPQRNRSIPLLLSTVLAEVAGNMVYVILMEKAFLFGDKTLSVGFILVLQSAAQTFLGTWEGALTDRLGIRVASIIGLLGQAGLALGLGLSHSIWNIYAIALLTTLARGLIIPARLSLVTRISSRSNNLSTNTAVSVLTGLGLLIGPALAATLTLLSQDVLIPSAVAAILLILSFLPLMSNIDTSQTRPVKNPRSVKPEVRQLWDMVSTHRPLLQVLVCLLFSSIMFGAIVPILTPLSRELGLGSEGTGILVAAMGFGWTIGPFLAGFLVKRSNYTFSLFVTGLLTPVSVVMITFLHTLPGTLIALALSSIGGAGLNVLVITILQRLTPEEKQGSIIGLMQTVSGFVWIFFPMLIVSLVKILPENFDLHNLFIIVGITGTALVLYCLVTERQHRSDKPILGTKFSN